jgi:hypothetical protein
MLSTQENLPVGDNFRHDELCTLCREGKVFEVDDWFKAGHRPLIKPPHWHKWPMGIAIENRNHSLVEVLLRNGIPADEKVLMKAVKHRRPDMIKMMIKYGADINSIPFRKVVEAGNPDVVQIFFDRGADLFKDYPFYRGLIFETKIWLSFYKRYQPKHPDLQIQLDMALRKGVEKESLKIVSLLMWAGANPRNPVIIPDDKLTYPMTALEAAASQGNTEIIMILKPDPKKDDFNDLMCQSISKCDFRLVQFWEGMGADMNHSKDGTYPGHEAVIEALWMASSFSKLSEHYDAFPASDLARTWFASGAKWPIQNEDEIRKVRTCLNELDSYRLRDFIELLLDNEVIPPNILKSVANTPTVKKKIPDLAVFIKEYVESKRRRRFGGAPYTYLQSEMK